MQFKIITIGFFAIILLSAPLIVDSQELVVRAGMDYGGSNYFMVEFELPSVFGKRAELQASDQIGVNKATMDQHSQILEGQHNTFRQKFDSLKSQGKILKEVKILGSYKKVYNGILLRAEHLPIILKSISNIKKIHKLPEYELLLQDTVSIVQATILWDADFTWDAGFTGEGIVIGVIDSGVDYRHKDLGGCTTSQFLSGLCNKVIGGYDFGEEDADPLDNGGHGTHVASIAAGKGDYNSNNVYEPSIGEVWGIAPDAKIMAYKVTDARGAISTQGLFDALESIEQMLADGVDVLTMSIGGFGNPDDPLSIMADNIVAAGIPFTVSAGNSGPRYQSIMSPATARKVITVGATIKQREVADFSSRGPTTAPQIVKPDIVAPGDLICAALWPGWAPWLKNPSYGRCVDEEHLLLSGTSMSAPVVAGGVALLKQAHPDWTPQEIKSALMTTAKDIGGDRFSQGAGMIDLNKAIRPNIYLDKEQLEFGIFTQHSNSSAEQVFVIKNLNDTQLGVNFIAEPFVEYSSGREHNILSVSQAQLCLDPQARQEITALVSDLMPLPLGNYFGNIKIEIYEDCSYLPSGLISNFDLSAILLKKKKLTVRVIQEVLPGIRAGSYLGLRDINSGCFDVWGFGTLDTFVEHDFLTNLEQGDLLYFSFIQDREQRKSLIYVGSFSKSDDSKTIDEKNFQETESAYYDMIPADIQGYKLKQGIRGQNLLLGDYIDMFCLKNLPEPLTMAIKLPEDSSALYSKQTAQVSMRNSLLAQFENPLGKYFLFNSFIALDQNKTMYTTDRIYSLFLKFPENQLSDSSYYASKGKPRILKTQLTTYNPFSVSDDYFFDIGNGGNNVYGFYLLYDQMPKFPRTVELFYNIENPNIFIYNEFGACLFMPDECDYNYSFNASLTNGRFKLFEAEQLFEPKFEENFKLYPEISFFQTNKGRSQDIFMDHSHGEGEYNEQIIGPFLSDAYKHSKIEAYSEEGSLLRITLPDGTENVYTASFPWQYNCAIDMGGPSLVMGPERNPTFIPVPECEAGDYYFESSFPALIPALGGLTLQEKVHYDGEKFITQRWLDYTEEDDELASGPAVGQAQMGQIERKEITARTTTIYQSRQKDEPCPLDCMCDSSKMVCPTGSKLAPLQTNILTLSGEEKVKIYQERNKLVVNINNVVVQTEEKLLISENKLYVGAMQTQKQVSISPAQASLNALAHKAVEEIENIELIQESERVAYSLEGTKQVKLFALISVNLSTETIVDAVNGNVVSIDKPWWSFLAF